MKMFRVLTSVVTLLALSLVAQADVIVYKGTAKITRGNNVKAKAVSCTAFFVTDFNTLQSNFIFVYTVDGVKFVDDTGTRNYGYTDVGPATPLVTGKTVYFTSSDGTFAATNNFITRSFRLGGKKAKLKLRATDTQYSTIPKSLTGTYSIAQATPTGGEPNWFVNDGTVSVSFNTAKTQSFNATNESQASAVAAIVAEYTSKGYTAGRPNP